MGAALISAKTVDKAPFKGLPYDYADAFLGGCKTSLSFTETPLFNTTNGNASFNASTGAKACPDQYGSDSAEILAGVGYNGSSWKQAKTASETVTFLFDLSYIAQASAKISKSASASASAYIYVESEVWDETNDTETTTGFATVVAIDVTTSTSSTAHQTDQKFSAADGPASYKKGDTYFVTVWLDIILVCSVSSTGSSSASAWMTLEPTGYQSTLESITIA